MTKVKKIAKAYEGAWFRMTVYVTLVVGEKYSIDELLDNVFHTSESSARKEQEMLACEPGPIKTKIYKLTIKKELVK